MRNTHPPTAVQHTAFIRYTTNSRTETKETGINLTFINIYCQFDSTNIWGPAEASSGLFALVLVWMETWSSPWGLVIPEYADGVSSWSLQTLLHIGLLAEELLIDVNTVVLQDAALHCLYIHSDVTAVHRH